MIIGISGHKGSGKSTVAQMTRWYTSEAYERGRTFEEFLSRQSRPDVFGGHYLSRFENKMFAGKLKEFCANILGVPIESFEDEEFKNSIIPGVWWINGTPTTYRQFLQNVGMKMREINEDFWVNALFTDYDGDEWIISDVRLPNEVKSVVDRDGILIRVERPITSGDTHITETALDNYKHWDIVINNNEDLEYLKVIVKLFLIEYKII